MARGAKGRTLSPAQQTKSRQAEIPAINQHSAEDNAQPQRAKADISAGVVPSHPAEGHQAHRVDHPTDPPGMEAVITRMDRHSAVGLLEDRPPEDRQAEGRRQCTVQVHSTRGALIVLSVGRQTQ